MANVAMIRILSCLRSERWCSIKKLNDSLPAEKKKDGIEHPALPLVSDLMRWGLVQAQDEDDNTIKVQNLTEASLSNARFSLSPRAVQIEKELDISLGGKFHTHFGTPKYSLDPFDIFVMMPFAKKYRPIYDKSIQPAIHELGLACKRADDFITSKAIMSIIWSAINQAEIIIGECSGKNSNVFYEIGIAHALGKPTILIAQTLDDIPFDLRHLQIIVYQTNTERKRIRFKNHLQKAIREIRQQSSKDD